MSGFLGNLAKALTKTEVDVEVKLRQDYPHPSNRPPYYNPSYPRYTDGPPPCVPSYPARESWPTTPARIADSYYPPGPPGPPVAPMYPALHPGGIGSSGRPLCTPMVVTAKVYPSSRGLECKPHIRSFVTPQIHTHSMPPGRSHSIHPKIPATKEYGWAPPPHCTGTVRFVSGSSGSIPGEALHAGTDKDGGPIYVGRAFHEGDLLPAKICPSHGCAYVSYDGKEITKMHYEVLCSEHVAWEYARDGQHPPSAVQVGQTSNGDPLFVGRTMIEGTMTPGKVHPSHGVLYIPYNGMELSFPQYEILILT